VWETLAMMHGTDYWEFPVRFEQIKFLKAVILSPARETEISINIQIGKEEDENVLNLIKL
jgi:hypothetical protein